MYMKIIQRISCGLLVGGLVLSCAAADQLTELVLTNGVLILKQDLTRGGAISYISLAGSARNLVNVADEGRYIQQSYYAGRSLDRQAEGQSPAWSPWSWNPIQAGDAHQNRARILKYQKTGDSLYVECVPMLWDMNDQPAEAELEQWTTLKDNVVQVRNRITCHRTDNLYGDDVENNQELPAVYPISALKNLYSYIGPTPFVNATLTNPAVINLSSGFWGIYGNVSEHWMAFLDDDKWGMGVYNAQCTNFLAGRSGAPGKEAADGSTSYIAPVKKQVLRKNSVYQYQYDIIIGRLDDIRRRICQLNSEAAKAAN